MPEPAAPADTLRSLAAADARLKQYQHHRDCRRRLAAELRAAEAAEERCLMLLIEAKDPLPSDR